MASSFEKSVKVSCRKTNFTSGATKHKLAAPKAKYVEHILIATHAGEAGIAEVFRAINNRLRDNSWTVGYHGSVARCHIAYLRRNPRLITLSHYSDAQIQGRNIRNYSNYLTERARTYGDVRTDFVRDGQGRLRKLSVEKGLLREVECVQLQIKALLKCNFLDDEADNEITLLAFRLLVSDLLELFHVVNEGVINVLEHYFEMSRYDAERALRIYKVFTEQTADVVDFLQAARRVETSTRLQIPNIKHAPTSLTSSLEEYLNDPDFDVNRRQYLAQKEAKDNGGAAKPPQPGGAKTAPAQMGPTPTASAAPKEPPKIAPDLIDFFESIETEQTPMFANQPVQQQQMASQMTGIAPPQMMANPYGQQMYGVPPQQQMMSQHQLLPNQTGGFPMGYQQNNNPFPQQPVSELPAQPDQQHIIPELPAIPQQFVQQQHQQQPPPPPPPPPPPAVAAGLQVPSQTGHNPFRQSMLMANSTGGSSSSNKQSKSTNPFARTTQTPPTILTAASPTQNNMVGRSATTAGSGTNPFARSSGISPQPTGGSALSVPGGTNPFRASMMLQQQQAQMQAQMQGNFSGQTGTMGGLETLETVPVFPRSNTTTETPPTNGAWQ
ncbi:ANTH domain-containing protein [Sphaerosporella brunnea]|uniref:ANTH domain-containing protein n=1 Tax=Sphaerosporella brunnea TaxID=1250544 RepID=A0A5J5F374_9PEZI|nr:ANTH domain-containing protein [Sphaerosporella brunnea]